MQRNVRDIYRKRNTIFVLLQPGTSSAKGIAANFLFRMCLGGLAPGMFFLTIRKPFDRAPDSFPAFQHHQMTRDADICLFRSANRSGDFLKAGALENAVTIATNNERWRFQRLELLPPIPLGHVLKIKLFEHMRRSK